MQAELVAYPNVSILEGKVADIVVQEDVDGDPEYEGARRRITGVRLEAGEVIPTNHVVITTGTFLGGEIHIGRIAFQHRPEPRLTWARAGRLPLGQNGRRGHIRSQQISSRRRIPARPAEDGDTATTRWPDD